jgi:ribosomal protein S18 acetylase RimI-like enzyme
MPSDQIDISAAAPDEFDVAADFWLAMRREVGMGDRDLAQDWKARSIAYCKRRHDEGELRWFFARDGDRIVASAAGFLLENYPAICLKSRTGYIAGVYVLPEYRKRGLGRAVTVATLEWLRSRGCRRIRLHAADRARPMYEALGFSASNEMILERR